MYFANFHNTYYHRPRCRNHNYHMNNVYTENEIQFLMENYSNKGIKYCATILCRTPNSIQKKCKLLGLNVARNWRKENGKIRKNNKLFDKYAVNPAQFLSINTPICAYILGLLWADGSIQPPYIIDLATTYPDANYFIELFKQTGRWKHYNKKFPLNPTWKPACNIKTSNFPMVNFLLENDYKSKSIESADKILSIIPTNIKHYWFRGLFDGDGHIYTDKNGSHRISFSSSYNQNWKYLEDACTQLNIKYNIHKDIRPNTLHSGSVFVIYGMYRVIKFCEFMYNGYPSDNIGLHRKYNKLLELKQTEEKNRYKGVCFSKKLNKWRTYTSAANNTRPISLGLFNTKEEAHNAIETYYTNNPKIFIN